MTERQTDELDILVTVRFRAGDEAEREALLREMEAETVAKDAGCLRYEWYRVKDEPNTYHLAERWTSSAAVEAHLAAPHMTALLTRFRALAPESFTSTALVRL
jgi:quinol monooxygenase YgiN